MLLGVWLGVVVGVLVGVWLGVLVGVTVGVLVGVFDGVLVGVTVGVFVGVDVGVGVGGVETMTIDHKDDGPSYHTALLSGQIIILCFAETVNASYFR